MLRKWFLKMNTLFKISLDVLFTLCGYKAIKNYLILVVKLDFQSTVTSHARSNKLV